MARTASITIPVVFFLLAAAAAADEPLFPQPLHLTRQVEDPVTGVATTVEEYFAGNRAVSIAADATAIVDYARGECIRIDRARGTWSVATLHALARAARAGRSAAPAGAGADAWVLEDAGSDRRGSRDVVVYRASRPAPRRDARSPGALESSFSRFPLALEIAIDRSVVLSRGGAEVIAGAAWPDERSPEAEAILDAARGEGVVAPAAVGAAFPAAFGLPLETILTWRDGDEEIRLVNRVVRVGHELPPQELLQIPRGARRVEDPRLAAAALLDALDRSGVAKE